MGLGVSGMVAIREVRPVVDPTPAMRRRRFLAMLGAAAAGAGGVSAGLASSSAQPEESPLPDAVSPDGERLGVRRLVYSVETSQRLVALTFDDGPDPDLTPRVLDVLDRFDVPATFCVMGFNAVEHPDLLKEMIARGHEIGSHTWNHRDLGDLTPDQTKRQLSLSRDVIRSITGREARYFRPPYGRLTGVAARYAAQMGYDVVLWSLNGGIARGGTPRAVADHMVGSVRPGDVVLLHDGVGRETFDDSVEGRGPVRRRREVEVRALPEIIERSLEGGLEFTDLTDLLSAHVIEGPR